ncbi:hypothetical protein GGF41_001026 [Coemansia sp. RSA 2531]|nr:hypothetical protein GGF41_001026 [Coemansia sp. RSA 2531]
MKVTDISSDLSANVHKKNLMNEFHYISLIDLPFVPKPLHLTSNERYMFLVMTPLEGFSLMKLWPEIGFEHSIIADLKLKIKESDSVLCHGDLGFYNVLTDGSKVTGIIDWEIARFDDSLYELKSAFDHSPFKQDFIKILT